MSHILYLGSESKTRHELLSLASIPFTTVGHTADERSCDWGVPFAQLLKTIAQEKMNHVVLPDGKIGDICFVLTADTMGQDADGTVHGKPENTEDARRQIKELRKGGVVATSFCLDRKKYTDNGWVVDKRIVEYVASRYEFDMPDHLIDEYFKHQPDYMSYSGSINLEGFAGQFLKSIDGSYTTIRGLPMFEVRRALEEVGFF